MDNEPARFLSQLTRLGKISTTMAGLATRMAGQKFFGIDINRADHAAALTAALGNLKGPIMKVGQILATIPEALPPEYAEAMQTLQANAPPMGWSFVRRRMRQELGADWESRFATFEQDAAAAASLGQVHRATLHDGRLVACKLQYPDMISAVESDLRQLKVIMSIYESYDRAVQTDAVHQELRDRLLEELDYTLEAKHERLFAAMLSDSDAVHIPAVVDELSTARLLVSTWQDGRPILNFKDAPLEVRNRIALNLFQAWYVPFYQYGVIHGDPHLGNYTIRPDHTINLLDFGCVRRFPPRFINGVIELYHALRTDDVARSVHAFELWGFENLSNEIIDALTQWARFLYGPVLEDKVRVIGVANKGIYGRETAQAVHQKLRAHGGIKVPREFVFMDRAALGLGSVFIHLQSEINWYQLFNDMISGFDPDALAARQEQAFAAVGLLGGVQDNAAG